ncbi:MAG: anthranilate synthase component II [Deltaproteobacteria bacterium]
MILIIDNYDSFTYNLYQYIGEINQDIQVYRNDKITIEEIRKLNPSHIVISPGPGHPKDAGITGQLIKDFYKMIPILGVCLGHQAIGEVFGGKIIRAEELVHGKASEVRLGECELFKNLPKTIKAGRYHSLVIDRKTLPKELIITAETDDECIMGIKHKDYPLFGIQFHPESILTENGMEILRNFLS